MVEGVRRVAHQSLGYFNSTNSTLEGVEWEVDSLFHLPHDFKLIIDHYLQPVVEFPGQTHTQDYQNFSSFYIVYGLVWGQVRVRVRVLGIH